MNTYERLEDEACKNGMNVITRNFRSPRIKGLYIDGVIGLNNNMQTSAEKICTLSEEMGHHFTSYGNILDLSDAENRKQEFRARMWAYNKQIGLIRIVDAYKHGCHNMYEMAEYLDVTEEFLKDALQQYRNKYGVCKAIDNYIIFFEPHLAVMEKRD